MPVFAVLLAVSGAYASSKFAPTFYENDSNCNEENEVEQPCTIGTVSECTIGTDVYYYKPTPSSSCERLYKNTL